MADNNFRSHRGRDAGVPIDPQTDDPLAELARLIGQSEPARELGRVPRQQEPALDWPAQEGEGARYPDEDRYAAQAGAEDYDAAYDDRYEVQPADEFLPDEEGAPEPRSGVRTSALATRLNGARDFARDYYVPPEQSRYREVQQSRANADREPPAFQADARVERYQYDEAVDDQDYALDEGEEDIPAGRRRSGFFVVAAVLGLAIIGTAGAFAYRAMFGSSLLPTLPPIIKADDGPNKIVPAKPKSSDQADASDTNSGEKLVSREEQPVDMPAPANATPRVVSTVPIFPDPNSGQAGLPNSVQSGSAAGAAPGAPMANTPAMPPPAPPPVATSTPPAQANSIWPPVPAPAAPAAPGAASPSPVPAAAATAPHKIHTVVIHADQLGAQAGSPAASMTADASTAPPLPAAPVEPAPAHMATARTTAPAAHPAAVARVDANGPLSIVPDQGGGPPPVAAPRLRTASARPVEAPAAPRGEAPGMAAGSYAVQVTSQRSEAGAQSEFRALKAKYPSQLGNREPLIRRADLGAKGVYYRALVGPFASAEQASAMCSGLKAAGGTCIVQRN